jgi:hypothetical protein
VSAARCRTAAWGIAFIALAGAAHAQSAPPPAPSSATDPSASAKAQFLFEKGVRAFESGAFEAALDDFRKSLEIFPTAPAWKNAALCLRELRRFDEALELLEALPARFPDLPADEVRKNALRVEELESQVGWVELRGVEPSSRLVIDGRDRGAVPPGSRVRMSNGSHHVVVIKEGMEPAEVSVAAVSGRTTVAEFDQRPAPLPAPRSWLLGIELGGAVTSTLGGDVAGCSSCERTVGGGGRAVAHIGHGLGDKWFVSFDAGYLMLFQNVDQRQDEIAVVGGTSDSGISRDDLSMRGALLGLSLGYRLPILGDSFARVGAGSFLGWVRDERHGDFNAASPAVSRYPVQQIQSQPAHYGYLSAALGVGFRPSAHVRLGAGLDAIAMVALRQPEWDGTCDGCRFTGSPDGESWFASHPLAGRFIVLVSPFVEAGYAF